MKRCSIALATLALSTQFAFAAPAPSSCPTAGNVKSVPLFMAQNVGDEGFVDISMDSYGTDLLWGFAIGPIQAASENEALQKGEDLLTHLTGSPVPQRYEEDGQVMWFCQYNVGAGVQAVTFYPIDGSFKASSLKRFG